MLSKLIPAGLCAVAALASMIDDVREAIDHNNFARGESIIQKYRAGHALTPQIIEALSWMGREALQAKQLDRAGWYAKETRRLALDELKKRPLDTEEHLPIALGAAIEVEAQTLNQRGDRGAAVTFLRTELATYKATSIRTRIQKNINLLSLEGKVAPALDEREFLGVAPTSLASLRGKPVLLFFWAHWCGDCKQEGPILAQIEKEFASKGLVVIAPTQRYGYVARGQEAGAADETRYIDQVRHKYYADLLNVAAPISEENFKNYGASTTPTMVLIDRQGLVRLYHPGAMTIEELRAALNRLG